MKELKLYNVIFPIWFLLFFPPVIIFTLAGNFIIDSAVVLACFSVFRLAQKQYSIKAFYWTSIFKVWLFGFLADMTGAALLLVTGMSGSSLGLPDKLITGINFDPFSNFGAVIIIVLAMLVSGIFIFLFNYNITFKKFIADKGLRLRLALTVAIVTMPWTFLLPTKWFYHGL